MIVYFSTKTNNTRKFVEKLSFKSQRIPIKGEIEIDYPFILFVPTYADANGNGAVPKQVIKFLNNHKNRKNIRGVISSGNRNFGSTFAIAGDIVSQKCNVPLLYRFELMGTEQDVVNVNRGLNDFWNKS